MESGLSRFANTTFVRRSAEVAVSIELSAAQPLGKTICRAHGGDHLYRRIAHWSPVFVGAVVDPDLEDGGEQPAHHGDAVL